MNTFSRLLVATAVLGLAGCNVLPEQQADTVRYFTLGNPADVEQIIDEAHQVIELPLHCLAGIRSCYRVVIGKLQDLQGIADGSQRVAKLMGKERQEFILASVGVSERLFHLPLLRHVAKD